MENTMNHKPLIYICSPYAGDIEKNRLLAMVYSRVAVTDGYVPIAPHLFFPLFLHDDSEEERALGMECGLRLLDLCEEIWVMIGEGVSEGMEKEIEYARKACIPTRFFILAIKEVHPE